MEVFDFSRSGFLAGVVSASAAVTARPTPVPSPRKMMSPAEIARMRVLHVPVPFRFDRERFKAMTQKAVAHRQVTYATSFQGAIGALGHMKRTLAAYADPNGFDAGPNATHVAAVFYGSVSYAVALDDAMYAKYPIPYAIDADLHPNDSTYTKSFDSMHANENADAYRALVTEHDASFFICNNALTGFAVDIARRMNAPGVEVTREQVVTIHDDFAQHFLPGTLLVPAGVAALNAVQEARYTLLPE